MASDFAAAPGTVLPPEAVELPQSDEERHSLGVEEVADAPASGLATPDQVELCRRRDEAIETLRAVFNLPE